MFNEFDQAIYPLTNQVTEVNATAFKKSYLSIFEDINYLLRFIGTGHIFLLRFKSRFRDPTEL